MARDLQASYLGMKGFLRISLFVMRQFYSLFSLQFEVVPQPVGQMPWDWQALSSERRQGSIGAELQELEVAA